MKVAIKHARWMVAVAAALFVLALPTVAWAASATQTTCYPNCQPPASVLGETTTPTTAGATTAVEGAQASNGSSLPFTGADIAGLTAIGVVAIGVGYAMHRRARTRTRIQG
ncbi:MAG TPA: hypothetical protein VFC33_19200 [Acidimicrobiia bacterium]|nr:hypothetical protein [Acidimicrobiia bacterium]